MSSRHHKNYVGLSRTKHYFCWIFENSFYIQNRNTSIHPKTSFDCWNFVISYKLHFHFSVIIPNYSVAVYSLFLSFSRKEEFSVFCFEQFSQLAETNFLKTFPFYELPAIFVCLQQLDPKNVIIKSLQFLSFSFVRNQKKYLVCLTCSLQLHHSFPLLIKIFFLFLSSVLMLLICLGEQAATERKILFSTLISLWTSTSWSQFWRTFEFRQLNAFHCCGEKRYFCCSFEFRERWEFSFGWTDFWAHCGARSIMLNNIIIIKSFLLCSTWFDAN